MPEGVSGLLTGEDGDFELSSLLGDEQDVTADEVSAVYLSSPRIEVT